jgi:16S rRNA G966 N2-methylase RsmD
MCHFISKNLEACKICVGHGEIFQLEIVPFLKRMALRKRAWDIVYFDPPYDADYDEILEILGRGTALRRPGGVLVVEHPAEMFFPPQIGVLKRRRVVREGDTALTIYERWR